MDLIDPNSQSVPTAEADDHPLQAEQAERDRMIAIIVESQTIFTRREVQHWLNGVGAFRTEAQLRDRLSSLTDDEMRGVAARVERKV